MDNIRSSIIKKNIIASFGVKIVSIITSLLLVPLMITYIDSEFYGIWITLTSIIGWISFFDIGLGNGLRNKLATSIAEGNSIKGRIYVSTTYYFMALIFLCVYICLYFFIPFINWSALLNISSSLNSELIKILRLILLFFSFQMVLKIVNIVIISHQENALASFIDTLGQILLLLIIFMLTKYTTPNLLYLTIAQGISPVLVLLIISIILYSSNSKYKIISPNIKHIQIKYAKEIFTLGGNFFMIQIAVVVLYQITNIIISRIAGPESVTLYNITYKYLSVSLMLFNIVMAPMWSAFTDAFTKQDYLWMNSIYQKLINVFYIFLILLLLMFVISPFVYSIWLSNKIIVPITLSLIITIYMGCILWNSIHSIIINGIGKIKLQLFLSLFSTFFNIPLALFLGYLIGVQGVVLSLIIFSLPTGIILKVQVHKILKKNANGIWYK